MGIQPDIERLVYHEMIWVGEAELGICQDVKVQSMEPCYRKLLLVQQLTATFQSGSVE